MASVEVLLAGHPVRSCSVRMLLVTSAMANAPEKVRSFDVPVDQIVFVIIIFSSIFNPVPHSAKFEFLMVPTDAVSEPSTCKQTLPAPAALIKMTASRSRIEPDDV